jgi:hypothetical protein
VITQTLNARRLVIKTQVVSLIVVQILKKIFIFAKKSVDMLVIVMFAQQKLTRSLVNVVIVLNGLVQKNHLKNPIVQVFVIKL